MSTVHPHWQATDEAPVPVRVALKSNDAPKVQSARVSRSPAAVLGILLAVTVGAVSYGTLDDSQEELKGVVAGIDRPKSAFDILAEQIATQQRETVTTQSYTPSIMQQDDAPLPTEVVAQAIPTNVNTATAAPMHFSAPQTMRQPETGPKMLVLTLIGAGGGIYMAGRRAIRAVR